MKTWMKVAIGCFAVAVIGFFLFIAGLVGLGYWARNKAQELTSGGPEAQEALKKANAVAFVRPEGGNIDEARLVKFIEVRAAIYSVYEKYEGEINERAAKVKEGRGIDFSDVSTGFTLVSELQKAEALALARYEMPEAEYEFITGEVYKGLWTDSAGDRAARIAVRQATRNTSAALKETGRSDLPPEAKEALADVAREVEENVDAPLRELEELQTSAHNKALFEKYKKDLDKYAMPGLRFLFTDLETPSPSPSGKK